MSRIQTRTSGTLQQDTRYTYCRNGNVASRLDALQNRTETFGYDDANRLRSAVISGGATTTWSYSASGNLTSTNEPGFSGCTWRYGEGAPGPHALTSIACGGSTYPFGYDANGNLNSSPAIGSVLAARSATFEPSKLATVQRGDVAYRMSYDTDGTRVVKQQTVGGTARIEYAGKIFDLRTPRQQRRQLRSRLLRPGGRQACDAVHLALDRHHRHE